MYDKKSGIYGYECYDAKNGKNEKSICTTGIASLGDGRFYISHADNIANGSGSYSNIYLYKWTGNIPF